MRDFFYLLFYRYSWRNLFKQRGTSIVIYGYLQRKKQIFRTNAHVL